MLSLPPIRFASSAEKADAFTHKGQQFFWVRSRYGKTGFLSGHPYGSRACLLWAAGLQQAALQAQASESGCDLSWPTA